MAIILGALMIQGIRPGPEIVNNNPDLFWGLIVSMWIGNLMLVVLNLPLIGIWISVLKVPYRLLFPAILVFSFIGIYSLNTSAFEVYLMAGLGIVGFLWAKLDCNPAPVMLGVVLGPMLEENLRRAMLISRGNPMVFLTRPISLCFITATILILIMMMAPTLRSRWEKMGG